MMFLFYLTVNVFTDFGNDFKFVKKFYGQRELLWGRRIAELWLVA